MTGPGYRLRFWGVRGSVPTPLAANLGYGGNTSCVSVSLGPDDHIILDCGTGIRDFGESLVARGARVPGRYRVFFSHYHLDHVQGLPFFLPLYDPLSAITFHGFESGGRTVEQVLKTLIAPPYFPVPLAEVPAKVDYVTLDEAPRTYGDLRVESLPLNHPNGSFSYRLVRGDRRIVYATDHEHGDEETDTALTRFAQGADFLIYDATYVPSEYEMLRRGWGHSTWYEGVRVARAAGAKTLVLFHHHPDHTDEQLEAVLRVAREELASVEIAREGMELPL